MPSESTVPHPDNALSLSGRIRKAFVPRRPGEVAVPCWWCDRTLATVVGFTGSINARCHSCKKFTLWWPDRGSYDAKKYRYAAASRMMLPKRCEGCASSVLWLSRAYGGYVYARCPSCQEYVTYLGMGMSVDVHSMAPDVFVATMEARWLGLVQKQARKRAEVAVGIRFDVFKRDGFRCRYCGRSADDGAVLHVDHVTAQSKGGPTTLENLVTACFECNLGKSDKDLGDIRPAI